ncbi:MAG: sigma-70 family RNA polymerase sigma factor [Myxococcales bacterium]|nr:sigma-70 family RNA polymerase sigma factor [Myxococcales bacterium]
MEQRRAQVVVLVTLVVLAAVGVVVPMLFLGVGAALGLIASPLAELLQRFDFLDDRPFRTTVGLTHVLLIGLFLWCAAGHFRGRQATARHPWVPLWVGLGVLVVVAALALAADVKAAAPLSLALVVASAWLGLFGVLAVAIALGRATLRWVGEDAGRAATASWALLGALGVGALGWQAAFAIRGYYVIQGGEPWSRPPLGTTDALRLGLGELAVTVGGFESDERPVAGVYFAPSAAVRRKQRHSPVAACYSMLVMEPDPDQAPSTPAEFCESRMRSAQVPDPQDTALQLVTDVCMKEPDDPVTYYSAACSNRISDHWRRASRRQLGVLPAGHLAGVESDPLLARCVKQAFTRLPYEQQRVLDLVAEGRDERSLGRRLGISEVAARKRLSRARQTIRQACLEDGW